MNTTVKSSKINTKLPQFDSLEAAFEDAISRAADHGGDTAEQRMRNAYAFVQQHQESILPALEALNKLNSDPAYLEQVQQLHKIEVPDKQQEAITQHLRNLALRTEFQELPEMTRETGLTIYSIGLSAALSFFIGVGGGVDLIVNNNTSASYERAYGLWSMGVDVVAAVGTTVGFWARMPSMQTSNISGFLADVFFRYGIRLLYLEEEDPQAGTTNFLGCTFIVAANAGTMQTGIGYGLGYGDFHGMQAVGPYA